MAAPIITLYASYEHPFDEAGATIDFLGAGQPTVTIAATYQFAFAGTPGSFTASSLEVGDIIIEGELAVTRDGVNETWHIDLSAIASFTLGADFLKAQQKIWFEPDADFVDIAGHTFGSLIANGTIIEGSDKNDTLSMTGFAEVVHGGWGNDRIHGRGGNDRLIGGGGQDRLYGGTGNDVLIAEGDGGVDLFGFNLLAGGPGNDRLVGGGGRDIFVFDAWPSHANADTIQRFAPHTSFWRDGIVLDSGVFRRVHGSGDDDTGELEAAEFHVGRVAHDSSDRIVYRPGNGQLLYDLDGTGTHGFTIFAQMAPHLRLSNADFGVFDLT